MTAAPLLDVKGLEQRYTLPRESLFRPPGQVRALNGVSVQVQAGKSLGQIADQRPGKSRDGLVADLEAKADARIKAAVDAGKITADQAAQLHTKVDAAIVKIVDHAGPPKPTAAG